MPGQTGQRHSVALPTRPAASTGLRIPVKLETLEGQFESRPDITCIGCLFWSLFMTLQSLVSPACVNYTHLSYCQFFPVPLSEVRQLSRSKVATYALSLMSKKRERDKAKQGHSGLQLKDKLPDWPRVSPKTGLVPEPVIGKELFVVPRVLTPGECEAFIAAAEARGFLHQGSGGPAKGEAYRDNHRISVVDEALADQIWRAGLSRLFDAMQVAGRQAVGLNPNVRFYRYVKGQKFGQHIDESTSIGKEKETEYTLLVYLSGEKKERVGDTGEEKEKMGNRASLKGGETAFYSDRGRLLCQVAPQEGLALLHRHGDSCLLHEAKEVKQGIKYVLRSDVIFGW